VHGHQAVLGAVRGHAENLDRTEIGRDERQAGHPRGQGPAGQEEVGAVGDRPPRGEPDAEHRQEVEREDCVVEGIEVEPQTSLSKDHSSWMPRSGWFQPSKIGSIAVVRDFDPVRLGSLETDAWVTYYQRRWGPFLRAAVGMVRVGFAMPWPRTILGAWLVLRPTSAGRRCPTTTRTVPAPT